MAALMVELVNDGNITGAVACRAKLQVTAARRSRLACLEHWRAPLTLELERLEKTAVGQQIAQARQLLDAAVPRESGSRLSNARPS